MRMSQGCCFQCRVGEEDFRPERRISLEYRNGNSLSMNSNESSLERWDLDGPRPLRKGIEASYLGASTLSPHLRIWNSTGQVPISSPSVSTGTDSSLVTRSRLV